MGHAGAIISGGKGTAQSKIEAFEKGPGIKVAKTPSEVAKFVAEASKQEYAPKIRRVSRNREYKNSRFGQSRARLFITFWNS